MTTAPRPSTPWTDEERGWAQHCLHEGDTLTEIAEAAGRSILDVAMTLGLYHAIKGRPWRRSVKPGGSRVSPWVGRLLKEVATARAALGEPVVALAGEAGVTPAQMTYALRR